MIVKALEGIREVLGRFAEAFDPALITAGDAQRVVASEHAKLVRVDFTQTITEHWRSRRIEWNRLVLQRSEWNPDDCLLVVVRTEAALYKQIRFLHFTTCDSQKDLHVRHFR
jgi:hypothetical protein